MKTVGFILLGIIFAGNIQAASFLDGISQLKDVLPKTTSKQDTITERQLVFAKYAAVIVSDPPDRKTGVTIQLSADGKQLLIHTPTRILGSFPREEVINKPIKSDDVTVTVSGYWHDFIMRDNKPENASDAINNPAIMAIVEAPPLESQSTVGLISSFRPAHPAPVKPLPVSSPDPAPDPNPDPDPSPRGTDKPNPINPTSVPNPPAGDTVNIFGPLLEQNINTRIDIKETTTTIVDNSIKQTNLFVGQAGNAGMAGTWVAEYTSPLVAKAQVVLHLGAGGNGGSLNVTGQNYWTGATPADGGEFTNWKIDGEYLLFLNGANVSDRIRIIKRTSGLLVLQIDVEHILNFTRK